MTTQVQGKAVHKISNRGHRALVVVLEPWGGEYDIEPDQALELVVEGNLGAPLEIEVDEKRLTITSDGPDLKMTRDGKQVVAR